MNLKKSVMHVGMAAALALSLTMPAFAGAAANPNTNGGAPITGGKGGETIISIFETDMDPENVSFEVPLYVTLGVVNNGQTGAANVSKVVAPTAGYYIKNTGIRENPAETTKGNIGVTGMYIAAIGNWSLAVAPQANTKELGLTFSADPTAAGADKAMPLDPVTPGNWVAQDIKTTNSIFYDTNSNSYYPIQPTYEGPKANPTDKDRKLEIKITGDVDNPLINKTQKADGSGNPAAAAQFRVTYVVSALDANNLPIGNAYVGNIYGDAPDFAMLEKDANGKVPGTRFYTNKDATPGTKGQEVNDPIKGSDGLVMP